MTNIKIFSTENSCNSDLLTPVSAFLRLRTHFSDLSLFESADFKSGKPDFSYLCFDSIAEAVFSSGSLTICVDGKEVMSAQAPQLSTDPSEQASAALRIMADAFDIVSSVPKTIRNGFFGYCSYAAVQTMETIVLTKQFAHGEEIPEFFYRVYRYVIAFDHKKQTLHFVQNSIGSEGNGDFSKILALITTGTFHVGTFQREGELESNLSDAEHEALVSRCQTHIQRGDVFQIVPSRRFQQNFSGDSFQLYRALRRLNPSPYLFYFTGPGFLLIGSSPEAQLEIVEGTATISPIAGTCFRTGDDARDAAAVEHLLSDEKENAEHVMLVDLARNDLSRMCEGIKVERFRTVEYYSHVVHLVSKVSGRLKEISDWAKVFTKTFPAGTLTGAPKIKAMQLLDIFEPTRRSFYGGSIGLIGFDQSIVQAIMIRTFFCKDGVLTAQAGGGVVLDSVPATEVQEVKSKLASAFQID